VTGNGRVLEVGYESAEGFTRDYRANLSSGGVFVATQGRFEPREIVVVRLCLAWCGREIDLEGEVVHIVPAELAGVGGLPGVAVQFLASPIDLRDRLAPLCVDIGPPPPPSADEERRAPRKSVRVPARIECERGTIRGRTRNLSHSGVLIGLSEGSIELGETVRVGIRHPSIEEELEVEGTVVRQVKSGGRVSAVAVQFEPSESQRQTVERFVEALQSTEATRRLGGITGPIAELGPQSIVQMFASTARRGTIVLRRGEEEGLICFEGSLMRTVRLGSATGMKALVRMLSWKEGSFEFHGHVEDVEHSDPPFPLEAAVFDAVRQIDEGRRDGGSFPLQARLVAVHSGEAGSFDGVMSKLEEALLDLAHAGFTVQRALEVIPEPDPEIFRALQSLIDGGMIDLR